MSNEFDLTYEIKKLTALLTKDIRSKSEKSVVAREYEDHIRDAMQHYMLGGMREEEAFSTAREDLGDIDEIAVTLGDVHNVNRISEEFKKRFLLWKNIWRIFAVVDIFIVAGLSLLPGQFWNGLPTPIFLFMQALYNISYLYFYVILCLGSLHLIVWLFRTALALIKRIAALSKIKHSARHANLNMKVQIGALTSLFIHPDRPAMILENDTYYFKVRFLTTVMKKRQLHFLGKHLFTVTKVQGGSFISPMAVSEEWIGFRPKNIAPMHSNVFVVRQTTVPVDAVALPFFECRHDPKDKTVKEILLFHPAPMAVRYQDGNTAVEIGGGEEFDGVTLFGLSGFCKMLERI